MREGHRLRMFDKKVLGRIFEPREDVTGGNGIVLHNEEFDNLYSSSDNISVVK
jgi:hypothetical protein